MTQKNRVPFSAWGIWVQQIAGRQPAEDLARAGFAFSILARLTVHLVNSQLSDFRDLLEVFDNPAPQRNFSIEHHCPEFTSVCPKTGQPDYGTIVFTYVPDKVCVELKSLKMYLQRFRNEGIFYEAVTNRLLDDFVAVVQPRRLRVESRWTPRGGLNSNIIVEYPEPE